MAKCDRCGSTTVIKRLRRVEGEDRFVDWCKACSRSSLKEEDNK